MHKKDYSQFLNQWDWEWFVTFTFKEWSGPTLTEAQVNRARKSWTRLFCTTLKMQVGYFYVLVFKDTLPHLHLLMVGRGKIKIGKTLRDVPTVYGETIYPWNGRIEIPNSNSAVTDYFAKNLLSDGGELGIYNIKLLNKMKRKLSLLSDGTQKNT